MKELKPCPFCGSNNLNMYAFSISSECSICCECGASITANVKWDGMDELSHDEKCKQILVGKWNQRHIPQHFEGETEK